MQAEQSKVAEVSADMPVCQEGVDHPKKGNIYKFIETEEVLRLIKTLRDVCPSIPYCVMENNKKADLRAKHCKSEFCSACGPSPPTASYYI